MKKVLLIYLVLIAGIVTWYFTAGREKRIFENSKGVALEVSKHSLDFNRSIDDVMKAYFKMTAEFVKEDTASISKKATELKTSLDNLKLHELNEDSSIYETAVSILDNAKNELAGIAVDPAMESKRQSLHHFSDQLYTLINTVRYDLGKLYWMECSSAFGDDAPGNWIGESDRSNDPYGKKGCATVKRVIDFAAADSTKK